MGRISSIRRSSGRIRRRTRKKRVARRSRQSRLARRSNVGRRSKLGRRPRVRRKTARRRRRMRGGTTEPMKAKICSPKSTHTDLYTFFQSLTLLRERGE